MLLTEPVRGAANLVIAALVRVIVPMIREADSIPNHMIMDVPTVNVGGQDEFILSTQNLLRQLQPNLMGLLRCHLSGSERLDQVAAQILALIDGVLPRPGKFNVGGFGGTAVRRNQQTSICFSRIADVIDGGL